MGVTDGRTDKLRPGHPTGHRSAIKRNDVLTGATTWVTLENSMFSERSQTQKAVYRRFLLVGNAQIPRAGGCTETESRVPRRGAVGSTERGGSGVTAYCYRVSCGGDGDVLEVEVMFAQRCECTQYLRIAHFKRVDFYVM